MTASYHGLTFCIKSAKLVCMETQEVPRREIWDLRRDEVEVLTRTPYEKSNFAAWHDYTIVNRMVKQGFLEADPASTKRALRVRCTERGMEAVEYFRQRKWVK